jgi:type IV pilus assembly protein PilA
VDIVKMFRKDEGFTLIELMVVVLIIGILVAIAIPVFNSAKANSQRKSCFANERTLEGAAHSYEASVGSLPDAGLDNLKTALNAGAAEGSYLASFPNCPGQGTYDWDEAVNDQVTCAGATVSGTVVDTEHGHF